MQGTELQRPLGRAEIVDLSAILASTPGALAFEVAHGFLTAVASAPTTIMPSLWQRELIGDHGFASIEQAKHVMGLVLRLYNQIITALTGGGRVPPFGPDDPAIEGWCMGYLKAARMDDVWNHDEDGVVFLFPLAVLAGEIDLTGEKDSAGRIIEDPMPQLRRFREGLNANVLEANRYWTAWRRKSIAIPVASRAPKFGRNEPCHCGSGLKFKKCCALKES